MDDADAVAERVAELRGAQAAIGRRYSYNMPDANDSSALFLGGGNAQRPVPRTRTADFGPTARRSSGLEPGAP